MVLVQRKRSEDATAVSWSVALAPYTKGSYLLALNAFIFIVRLRVRAAELKLKDIGATELANFK